MIGAASFTRGKYENARPEIKSREVRVEPLVGQRSDLSAVDAGIFGVRDESKRVGLGLLRS